MRKGGYWSKQQLSSIRPCKLVTTVQWLTRSSAVLLAKSTRRSCRPWQDFPVGAAHRGCTDKGWLVAAAARFEAASTAAAAVTGDCQGALGAPVAFVADTVVGPARDEEAVHVAAAVPMGALWRWGRA
eukprot:826370-Pleurochrysis_carterae.AAC.1